MHRYLLTPRLLNIWKVKTQLSQEQKEPSKWNQKHPSLSQKCPLLDTQNKLAKMQQTQPLKIYPPGKLKQLLVIFILNDINSSLIMQKKWSWYVTLLVHKHFISIISYMS